VAAAADLLREYGVHGLTIEAVAARSGVAKTTIYRHFSGREELHVAAMDSAAVPMRMVATSDLVGDVTSFCVALSEVMQSPELAVLVATAIEGAERSPVLAATLERDAEHKRAALVDRLEAAVAAGELPAGTDVEVLHGQLVGPIFFRRFISRQPTDAQFVARNVAAAITQRQRRQRGASGGGDAPPR
jgi:AcrR family transcriptional regulator